MRCECEMCVQNRAFWEGPKPERSARSFTAADYATREELESRRGLSSWARREQRKPVPIRVDELGFDRGGRYWPQHDGSDAA